MTAELFAYPERDDDPTDRGLSPVPEPEPHACVDGWIDRERAVPCLTCKPHLTRLPDRWAVTRAPRKARR